MRFVQRSNNSGNLSRGIRELDIPLIDKGNYYNSLCSFILLYFTFLLLIHSSVHNSEKLQKIRKVIKISKNSIKPN